MSEIPFEVEEIINILESLTARIKALEEWKEFSDKRAKKAMELMLEGITLDVPF